ncbi:MAG TPA: hypothetical protein VFI53_15440, partial [Myxococcaceae bacterium]|nr:hypothetical protein [Myxococcaceae bacterium]
VIGDALKIAVGAATGDFVTLMQGSTQLLKDLASSAAETEYAPPEDEAYGGTDGWAPTASLRATDGGDSVSLEAAADDGPDASVVADPVLAATDDDADPEEIQALDTLAQNFEALNPDRRFFDVAGDKVITEKELQQAAENPDAPLDLKRAARYVLDHPDLLDELARSRDGDAPGIARSDLDLVRESRLSSASTTSALTVATGGLDDGPLAGDVDPEERSALETLARSFDALNRDRGFLGAFGDKVITEKELRETAEDPDAPVDLKRAARYVLDHPDLLERLSRSRDGSDQGIARGDIDLASEGGSVGSLGSTSGSTGARNDELSALRTLLFSFDGINRWGAGLVPPDRVLSKEELQQAASDARTSPSLKRALRYVLDRPTLLSRLSRSEGNGVSGISRTDLELGIEDARRGATTSGTKTSTGTPRTAATTSTGSSSKSSTSRTRDPSIKDILNDKSLSIEEKIEMILLVLENRVDDQMLPVTQQMDQNDDKKTNKDDRKKVTKLDKVDRDLNFKMERLMKRKEQLSNLLSTMEMKFASMAQTAIANMGR